MRRSEAIGRRIVHIEQARTATRTDAAGKDVGFVWDVHYIELDNGVRLYPFTVETDYGEYLNSITVNTVDRKKRAPKRPKPAP